MDLDQLASLRHLYPFENRYFEHAGGYRQHYLDEGQGPPVLMVHGNPTWSFFFRKLVLALRERRRCIVPDHVGCGLSDRPGDEAYAYTLEQRARDLDALVEQLSPGDKIALVVHDWGGMIGMAWALRHLERIERIVLFNTAAFPKPASKTFPWQLTLCRSPLVGPLLVRGLNGFVRYAQDHCSVKKLPADVAAGYGLPYASWANRRAVLRFVQDIPLGPGDTSWALVNEVADSLPKFAAIPKLICWGEQDFVFDQHFLAEWKRRCPEAEVHTFPEAGHYVLEDAGDQIVPLVERFL
ncbi:MAG: alpha/beta fold hydrolase [Gemmataceae bacterium]